MQREKLKNIKIFMPKKNTEQEVLSVMICYKGFFT